MKRILTALACTFAMACNAQMIAAQKMAFGGAALPYDAEVEYVTTTADGKDNYFKTGITINGDQRIILTAKTTNTVGDSVWFGFASPNTYLNGASGTAWFRYAGYSAPRTSFSANVWHRFENGRTMKIDDNVLFQTENRASTGKEVYLFRVNGLNYAGPIGLHVSRLEIYDDTDALVCDAIPVLKKSDVEMYNRVSKTFFEKVGTYFAYGPIRR